MIVPVRLAVALALLLGTAARAEAARSRTKRERPVTVTGNPADPLPEVHVAADTLTLLWFPADIQQKTLKVDESRIRVLDTGSRSIVVQAVPDYRADERHELEVFFADGKAPARAAFVLVMDPADVDTRIDVERSELPSTPCSPDMQRTAPLPEDIVMRDLVDERGVQTAVIKGVADSAQGFELERGVSYRGNRWVLLDMVIQNSPGRPSFSPHFAAMTGKGGITVQARVATEPKGAIAPGQKAWVFVVADEPPERAGLVFTLEVRGDDGRSLVIPRVTLPKPVAEVKR